MVAVLICCAIFGAVGLFAYSRYKAAEAENAAFRVQLQSSTPGQAPIGARMPAELPPQSTSAGGPAPSPDSGQAGQAGQPARQ